MSTSISQVDSTHRLRWVIDKEKFDKCEYPEMILSHRHSIDIDGEESMWRLVMYPKGYKEKDRNEVVIFLAHKDDGKTYNTKVGIRIETETGHWPDDVIAKMYSRGSYNSDCYSFRKDGNYAWGQTLCKTDEFEKYFVENKVTIVASIAVYIEGDQYSNIMEVADEFVDDMRSMSQHDNLTDFTIISGDALIPCHRVLLATRSKYFETLFRNEPTKKELKMDESPELVKAVLEFMSKGLIPDDIDDIAIDLILMSDMYCLDLLTVACETSLVKNLSPDNAVETLVTIDKLKHVSKLDHRQKVLAFIKKDADKVVKTKDWKKFVLNYPDLITEILVLKDENLV